MTPRFARRLLSSLFISLAAWGTTAVPAHAETAATHAQVPGFYRYQVGGFEVTALNDGLIQLDAKLLKNASQRDIQRLLARSFRTSPTATAVNAFLVNTGSQLVLIDAGAAQLFGPGLGQVLSNLRAAGYTPEQVDVVLLTHLHGDHVGGLVTAEGQRVFPNAKVMASRNEADFWLSAEVMAKAPEASHGFFKMAQGGVAPYQQAQRFETFDPLAQADVVPGIRPVFSPGHTPGHTGFMLTSQGQQLYVWGDIVHNTAVQFVRPEVSIEFDSDPARARTTRAQALRDVARQRVAVAGAHLPFPGIGHVRHDGKRRYSWVPVDFTPAQP